MRTPFVIYTVVSIWMSTKRRRVNHRAESVTLKVDPQAIFLRGTVMTDKGDKGRKAREKRHEAEHKFKTLIRKYINKHKAPASDVSAFGDMLGYGRLTNAMLACDLPLRRRASKVLGQGLEKLRKSDENLDFQFWTLLHERGNTSDREPIIDLKCLRSMADNLFRKLGLNAIYVIELQGLGNYPQKGEGRTLMAHVHAITWSNAEFNLLATLSEIRRKKVWPCNLEGEPVVIKPIPRRKGELEYLAYYLLKPPYEAKMLEERVKGARLKSTEKGYRPEFAARILEGLVQMELMELVRAQNGGKVIRQDLDRRVKFWHRSRPQWESGTLPAFVYSDVWDRYRQKKRKSHYAPYVIVR